MGLFHKSTKENTNSSNDGDQSSARRSSVRALQARAFDVWNSATYSRKGSNGGDQDARRPSGFDVERARRAAEAEGRSKGEGTGLVMRT